MTGYPYATVQDVVTLLRPLTTAETERANALLPLISDTLREAAHNVGQDLDCMIAGRPSLAGVAKLVTVDVLNRILRQSNTGDPMSQESQTALGYTWSGTYAIPGGGMAQAIMRNDLKRLGIGRQKIRMVDLYDKRNPNLAIEANPNGCG